MLRLQRAYFNLTKLDVRIAHFANSFISRPEEEEEEQEEEQEEDWRWGRRGGGEHRAAV